MNVTIDTKKAACIWTNGQNLTSLMTVNNLFDLTIVFIGLSGTTLDKIEWVFLLGNY